MRHTFSSPLGNEKAQLDSLTWGGSEVSEGSGPVGPAKHGAGFSE